MRMLGRGMLRSRNDCRVQNTIIRGHRQQQKRQSSRREASEELSVRFNVAATNLTADK